MKVPAPVPEPESERPSRRKLGPGEPSKNYTKVPNAYDYLIRDNKLSGSIQRDILWITMRMTWGTDQRAEWAEFSLAQIAERCGGVERSNISTELADLVDRKIMACRIGEGCQGLRTYKVTPHYWKSAEPYQKKPDPRTGNAVTPASGDRLIVRPGNTAVRIGARLQPAGSEPVDFQISYSNTGTVPVEVSNIVEGDLIRITFGDQKAKQDKGVFSVENRQKAKTGTNNRLIDFSVCVQSLLSGLFDKPFSPPDLKFLGKIVKAAGPNLTAEAYEHYCRTEVRAMVRKRKDVFPGILIPLAEQAAKDYAARQMAIQQAPPASPPLQPIDQAEAAAGVPTKCQPCDGTGRRGYWEQGLFKLLKGQLGGKCVNCNGTGNQPTAVKP